MTPDERFALWLALLIIALLALGQGNSQPICQVTDLECLMKQ